MKKRNGDIQWRVSASIERCSITVPNANAFTPNSVPQSQIALPPSASELLAQYDEACEDLDAATERKQKVENLLKEMMAQETE